MMEDLDALAILICIIGILVVVMAVWGTCR